MVQGEEVKSVAREVRLFEAWPAVVAHSAAIAIAGYSLLLPPNDVAMFSWARLVQMKHAPGAVFETWLSRGFGYKILFYALYVPVQWLASFASAPGTVFVLGNLAILILAAIIAAVAARSLQPLADEDAAIGMPATFSCLFALLCAVPIRAFGEPEHFALMASVLLGCIVLGPKPVGWLGVLACALLGLAAASQKGITAAFLAPVFFLALAARSVSTEKVGRIALALGLAFVAYAVCLVSVPRELRDLLDAANFQTSFRLNAYVVYRLFRCLITYTLCQPSWLLAAGFAIAAVGQSPELAGTRGLRSFFQSRQGLACVGGALVLLSLTYALVQNEYYSYHYLMLHLAAILVILFVTKEWKLARYFIALSVMASLAAPLLSLAPRQQMEDSFFKRSRTFACQSANGEAIAAGLAARKADASEPILYLTGGGINYFAGAPSYDPYFIMMPLQRTAEQPALASTPLYKQTLAHVLGYRGRFVVWGRDWMTLDDTPGLKTLVFTDYRQVPLRGGCEGKAVLFERIAQGRGA